MTLAPSTLEIARFSALAALLFGLRFDDTTSTWLSGVLQRRAMASRLAVDLYLDRLEGGLAEPELDVLAQELTVPETYFFRNMDQLRALQEIAVPERLRLQGRPGRLKILSAGCASGEEPYSIAMTLDGLVQAGSCDLSIHALDLNPEMIRKARRARYAAWSLRDTPADLQTRWFRMDGGDYVLDAAKRFAVNFEVRNLCHENGDFWRADTFDIVFCRNVLMYLAPQNARTLVTRLWHALRPGGYLFLGHAETLRGVSNEFQLRHTHETFYYQRNGADEPAAAAPTPVRHVEPTAATRRSETRVGDQHAWFDVIEDSAARIRALTSDVALAAIPQRTAGHVAQAIEFLRQERFAQALDALHALPPDAAADPATLLLSATLLTHRGQFEEAEAACRRLLAVDGSNADAHYVLALCREGVGGGASAADLHSAATALDPAFAMPCLHLGLLARRSGDRDAARRELVRAQALLPREDPTRLMLFGGGFTLEALLALCQAELDACGRPT